MSNPDSDLPAEPRAVTLVRAKVLRRDAESFARPAIVSLLSDPKLRISTTTDSDENLCADLRQFAGQVSPLDPNAESVWQEIWNDLQKFLVGRGYTVDPLPKGDIEFSGVIDLDSGATFGEQRALHEFAVPSNDLGQLIFKAVRDAFVQPMAELAKAIAIRLSEDDHAGAGQALIDAKASGLLAFRADDGLLNQVNQIDRSRIAKERQAEFARTRAALLSGAGDHLRASEDVDFLVESMAYDTEEERLVLRLAIGLGALMRGSRETALAIFREVAESNVADTSNRAWAYRNMALAISAEDPSREEYAGISRSLFMAAGDRSQAFGSLRIAVESRLRRDPGSALQLLETGVPGYSPDDLSNRVLRGRILLERGEMALRLGRKREATEGAQSAANQFRGVLGAETLLLNALALEFRADESFGHSKLTDSAEYERVFQQVFGGSADLRQRIISLQASYDATVARRLLEDVDAIGDGGLRSILDVLRALHESELDHTQRVQLLESAASSERATSSHLPRPALHALASELLRAGQHQRALNVYRELLEFDPLDSTARQNIAALLFDMQRFPELISFLESQARVWGPRPGIQTALGHALLETGEYSRAASALFPVTVATGVEADLLQTARELLGKAIAGGGTYVPTQSRLLQPVTQEEFDAVLREFCQYVQADARKSFWSSDGTGKRSWIERPESHAKDLFHTFVKGALRSRVEIFDEIGAGAGRIDLYLLFQGGMRSIVELKMLGGGYSTSYAYSGADQVTHYMNNRSCHFGYLVVFDARIRDWGILPKAEEVPPPNTVIVVSVDTRFEVK